MSMLLTPPLPIPIGVASGGTGAATAGNARTNLGLGTAAVKATGISGDAVPVLNGAATTWAAGADFGGNVNTTGVFQINGSTAFQISGDYTLIYDATGSAAAVLGGTGDPTNYYRNTTHTFQSRAAGATFATMNAAGLDLAGLLRCDSFRIDQAAAAEVVVQSHTVTVSLNGTDYKLLCLPA